MSLNYMPDLPLLEAMINEAMATEGHPETRPITLAEVEELKSVANTLQVALQCVTRPGWQEPGDRTELDMAQEAASDMWSQLYRLSVRMAKEAK